MWASSMCCCTLLAWTGTFPVCSSDKCWSIIAAVACSLQILPRTKSLQSSHSQLTSTRCPIMSFKPVEPHERGTTHWDLWMIWMEWLSGSDTVGNEDEIGSSCLKLMGMDCVRGDIEPHLLEATAGGGPELWACWSAAAQRDWCCLPSSLLHMWPGQRCMAKKVRTRIQWSRGCSN